MCVPTEMVEKVANLFLAQPDSFEFSRASALSRVEGMEHHYPRFKCVGIALFFILKSSQACHLQPEFCSIEYSQNGLLYPKPRIYAQSLLDTWNLVDLDDLVDGMNLTSERGEANLDLEGTIDAEWGRWKASALHNGEKSAVDMPVWCSDPMKRRDIWNEAVSSEGKRDRQCHKFLPGNETSL